jgi:hypothetical protein
VWAQGKEIADINPLTLCPGRGPASYLLVLLDVTDPLSMLQTTTLKSRIDAAVASAPVGTMMSVGVVSTDGARIGSQIGLCKPKPPEAASQLSENPRLIAERSEEKFLNLLLWMPLGLQGISDRLGL